MPALAPPLVRFDLLKVGHCQHPECVALRGGSRRAIDFPALVGLIEHPTAGLILYDTGYSPHFHEATRHPPECLYRMVTPVRLPPEEHLLQQLEARRIRASDISLILISHFHADHVAGLRDFPRARFIATRSERDLRLRTGRLRRLRKGYLEALIPADFESRVTWAEDLPSSPLAGKWAAFEKSYDLLGDRSLRGIDLKGHTASQLGVTFHTEQHAAVFLVGDACWKLEGLERDQRPSRLAYTLFDDRAAYDATFTALQQLHADPEGPLVIPSHCTRSWQDHGGSRNIHRD